MKPILLGADHAGFPLKERIRRLLQRRGIRTIDLGAFSPDPVDYPDIAGALARSVARGRGTGILCCGSGVGMSIAANKVAGVRAVLAADALTATLSRAHNDANVLCLGSRLLPAARLPGILRAWMGTTFEGGRHRRRVRKISALERC
ncbi:MAG: ribose 5-phosphate isomerase B [Planctomycetota bacterium]